MKKIFLLAMSALVVLGCNSKSNTSQQGDEKKEKRELKTEVYKYENSNGQVSVKLSIEFPVGGDKELGDNIYDFILEGLTYDHDCSDDLDEYRNNGQGLVDLFGPWKKDDLQEEWNSYTEDTGEETEFSSSTKFSVVEDNDNYITYLWESESFNGADGFWMKNGVTFLKSDCSRVTNEYLFKDPTSQELVTVLRNDLIERYCKGEEANWDEPDEATVKDLLEIPFYVTPKGLAYYYRRGLVFFQNVEGVLPWNKVKGLLTDEAQKLI